VLIRNATYVMKMIKLSIRDILASKADLISMDLTISYKKYNTKDGWSSHQADIFGEDGVDAYRVSIKDKTGKEISRVGFGIYTSSLGRQVLECLNGDGGAELYVDPEYRRRGLASVMYDYAQEISGLQVKPSPSLTDDGQSFWSSR